VSRASSESDDERDVGYERADGDDDQRADGKNSTPSTARHQASRRHRHAGSLASLQAWRRAARRERLRPAARPRRHLFCCTEKVLPPAMMLPERAPFFVVGATEYVTCPVPVPLAPPMTVSHDVAFETAVHAQPAWVFTVNAPLPPLEEYTAFVGV